MMKKIFSIMLFLLPLLSSAEGGKKLYLFSYFKGNGEDGLHLAYSLDGLTYTALNNDKSFLKPNVGTSKLMRDPCIIQTQDGVFHLVWTAGWTERGIGYASSKNLVNWSEQKYLNVMEKEPEAKNCWAPEIIYDNKEKQFMIFWATTIPGRFPESEQKGDGSYNHRIYYATTRDFTSLSETMLLYDKGFNVIDATIVNHGREFVMFLKDETKTPPKKNILVSTSRSLYGPFTSPSSPITGNYWAEGPTAIKINGKWIVYFDKYIEKKMGAVMSTDLKTWEDISNRISFPAGTRHGTIFEVNKRILSILLKQNE